MEMSSRAWYTTTPKESELVKHGKFSVSVGYRAIQLADP